MNIHVQPGIYEHYKSTPSEPKRYKVIGVARHSETAEYLVVYLPLYKTGDELWVRPLSMFTENVEINGVTKERFRYISAEASS